VTTGAMPQCATAPELATRPTTSVAWRAPGTGCEGRQPAAEPRHKRGTTIMNIDVLAIAGIALLLIFRLERVGKQVEAVRYELMPDARRRDELARHRGPHWTLGATCALVVVWLHLHSQAEPPELAPAATPLRLSLLDVSPPAQEVDFQLRLTTPSTFIGAETGLRGSR
jgi:hypothetical protein